MTDFERYTIDDDTGRIYLKSHPFIEIAPRKHLITVFIGEKPVHLKRADFLFKYVWKLPMSGNYLLHLDGDRHNYGRSNLIWITSSAPSQVLPLGKVRIGDTVYPAVDVAAYKTGLSVGHILYAIRKKQLGYYKE